MLEAVRNFAMSPVGKVVFVVVLIAFGAGFWYVGGPTGGAGVYAVRVGDVAIRPETLAEEYRRELDQLRRAGQNIDAEQAEALGLPQAVTARVVGRTLLDAEAQRLGLTASDERLRAEIVTDPVFRGPGDTFDRDVYAELLRRAGFTERQYEERMRADLARNQYVGAVEAGVVVPQTMAESLYRLLAEKRAARLLTVAAEDVPPPDTPDEAALRAWYQDHTDQFMAPETRTVAAVVLRPEAVAEQMQVTEAEIQAAYDTYLDRFTTQERRTLRQMILPDEAAAERAYERLQAGADFATVAADVADLPAEGLELGTVSREALLPEVADAAFALQEGQVSEPVQTLLGWHIVAVDNVVAAEPAPLSEVRDEVRELVAAEKALEELTALATALDDALGGGAGLEAAAAELALPVERFGPFDAAGRDPEGRAIADLPADIVEVAFATPEGMESLLEDLDAGGAFVLRVDRTTPETLRPFEAVRDEVTAAVRAERRIEAAEARAEDLAERLDAGAELAELAAERGDQVIATEPFQRDGTGAGTALPSPLITALFAAEPGEPVQVTVGDTVWLGEVAEVVEADPAADPRGVAAVEGALDETLSNEIVDQLISALQMRHPVEVNQQVLDQIF